MQQGEEDLRHQIQHLEKRIEQLTTSHQEEKYSYIQRINELSNKIQQTENATSSLAHELQNTQSVCSSLEADNSSLRQALREAKQQLNTSELEITRLKNRLKEVARQQREVFKCLDKMKNKVIDLTNLKHEQLQVIQNLKQENEYLASQIAQNIERMSADGAEEQRNSELAEKVNQSTDDTLNINSLPDEDLLKIFGYLKQNQLGQIARVCRRWNMLTRSPILWIKVNVCFSPSQRSPTAITKSFINRLPSCVTSISLDFTYNDGKLDFAELCVTLQEKCPHLKVLILNDSEFPCSFSSVIDLCSQYLRDVMKLVICYSIFSTGRSTGEWDGTSKIEILYVINCGSHDNGTLDKPPFSRMPYLKKLQLSVSDIGDSWFEGDTSFLNQLHVLNVGYTRIQISTFRAIQDHGHNLKELCLCLINLQDHDLNINHSAFPQLKTICLTDCDYVTCEGVVSLLQLCQSLQNVYVDENIAKSIEAHPFVVANRCKSGIVKAIECNHYEEMVFYADLYCTFE